MSKEGWISVHRQIQDCWIWQDDVFSRGQAWIDLLLFANHKDVKIAFGNQLMNVEKGSFITSKRKLSERWKWSNTKVDNFLKLLSSDNMIVVKSDTKKTLITIVNYGIYQDEESKKTSPKRNKNETKTKQKRTDNNDNNNYLDITSKDIISNNNISGEQKVDVFLFFNLKDDDNYPVTVSMLNEYKELYPYLDVEQELRSMKAWLFSNPSQRKTTKGVNRFVNSWLERSQNKGKGKYNQAYIPQQNKVQLGSEYQ